jgi:cell division protease FtsH
VNKRWKSAGLYSLLAIVVIALATTFFERTRQNQTTATYSAFIEKVKAKEISQVGLSSDRTRAIFTSQQNNGRVVVNLPKDPQLISILTENRVDIVVIPQNDDSIWFRILRSLLLPGLLLIGIPVLLYCFSKWGR